MFIYSWPPAGSTRVRTLGKPSWAASARGRETEMAVFEYISPSVLEEQWVTALQHCREPTDQARGQPAQQACQNSQQHRPLPWPCLALPQPTLCSSLKPGAPLLLDKSDLLTYPTTLYPSRRRFKKTKQTKKKSSWESKALILEFVFHCRRGRRMALKSVFISPTSRCQFNLNHCCLKNIYWVFH